MFDYNNSDEVSADALAEIVGEMSGGSIKPLSDEERERRRLEHEQFMAESRGRYRQQRLVSDRIQAEAAAEQEREAKRQAAIAAAERNERLRDEMDRRNARYARDKTLTGLLDHAIEQRQYRANFTKSATNAAARKRLSTALDNAIAIKYPPPTPEPAVVVVSEDDGSSDFGSPNFDVAKWSKKPRSWW
jgi:hypothetical protein